MKFYKMNGIGNDFIMLDAFHDPVENPAELAVRLCRRRLSVGADGLIVLEPTPNGDAFMRLFNNDGSPAEMCGNGIRCTAKLTYDLGIARRDELIIDTPAGIRHIRMYVENGKAVAAMVDMGVPDTTPAHIPLDNPTNEFTVDLGGTAARFFCVSLGVPHAVTYDVFPEEADFRRFGAFMETHPKFPHKANIDFARVDDRGNVTVKVWERGCGPTLGCGTGSCAALTAGVTAGIVDRDALIHLPGGTLHDVWAEDGHIYMTGPAELSYIGEI